MSSRSCAAIIDGNRILMIKQHYKGEDIWTFPGGRIEEGESPFSAAIRETKEETNLDIEIIKPLTELYSERIRGMYYCYLARIIGGNLELGQDPELDDNMQEIIELKWMNIHDMKDHKEVRRIIDFLEEII